MLFEVSLGFVGIPLEIAFDDCNHGIRDYGSQPIFGQAPALRSTPSWARSSELVIEALSRGEVRRASDRAKCRNGRLILALSWNSARRDAELRRARCFASVCARSVRRRKAHRERFEPRQSGSNHRSCLVHVERAREP